MKSPRPTFRLLYELRVRLRRWLLFALLIAAYLCTGAAWKVAMILRHPTAGSFSGAISSALRPYSLIPVGYALGDRFGRLASAFRLANGSNVSVGDYRRAAGILQDLVRRRGSWSDVAAYELASLEGRPDTLHPNRDGVRTLFMALDTERWARTSAPFSSQEEEAERLLRDTAERYPTSPAGMNALTLLSSVEAGQWEFVDARAMEMAGAMLRPDLAPDLPGALAADSTKSPLRRLASAYATYLKASEQARRESKRALLRAAIAAGDAPLVRWLGGELPAPPRSGLAVTVTIDGRPAPGARVALLQVDQLQSAMRQGAALAGSPGVTAGSRPGDAARMVDNLNPVRRDDPMRLGGLALISLPVASFIARQLPVAITGSDGAAHFGSAGGISLGAAALIDRPPGSPEVTLRPSSDPVGSGIHLVAPVEVLTPIQSGRRPPTLRWRPYPGAARYRAAVILQPQPRKGAISTALSAGWDSRVVWWRDGIAGASVEMDPGGFVGPPSELPRNGLWVGWIYRILVVAEDASGQPLATSIGTRDHRDEFFSTPANWLALLGPNALAPGVGDVIGIRLERTFHRPLRRGDLRAGMRKAPDPLEHVLDLARSLAPPALPGSGDFEAALKPVPAHSGNAVRLAPWPSVTSAGQGMIPLLTPFGD